MARDYVGYLGITKSPSRCADASPTFMDDLPMLRQRLSSIYILRLGETQNARRVIYWKAAAESTAAVEQFNARLADKKTIWFWPTIGAALISKYHWLIVACGSCDTINHLDLTLKRRDPNAPICVALDDVRCPRCNGHGRNRIATLAR